MKIGIMGAPIDNGNLGCMALTYSLLSVLDEIKLNDKEKMNYIIFDWKKNEDKMKYLASKCGIPYERLSYGKYSFINDPVRCCKNIFSITQMIRDIKKCDCIIDLTEGDSFSSIYGKKVFDGRTNVKLLVERLKVPLILGPQTYGPFLTDKNIQKAQKAISHANLVFTRDQKSKEFIESLNHNRVFYTTDLAFNLPCEVKPHKIDKIKVGINASNLLANDDNEMDKKNIILKADYSKFLREIIDWLLNSKKYEVYLISHVSEDYKINSILHNEYPQTKLVKKFNDPVEAKECISKMDIFIGARMHATIAAFTTKVPCIPTSYSPKFGNLFHSLNYDVLVDLTKLDTIEAIEKTKKYIDDYNDLKKMEIQSEDKWNPLKELFVKELTNELNVIREKYRH